MVLAATLCLKQAARLRPSINQVTKITMSPLFFLDIPRKFLPIRRFLFPFSFTFCKILKILRGECDVDSTVNFCTADSKYSENAEDNHDDEVYPESGAASHLGLALLGVCDDSTSFSSSEQPGNSPSMEGYVKGR